MPPARATAIRHVRWLGARLVRLRAALGRRLAALRRRRSSDPAALPAAAASPGSARAPADAVDAAVTVEAAPPAPPAGPHDLRRPWASPRRSGMRLLRSAGARGVSGARALGRGAVQGARAVAAAVVARRVLLLALAHRALWWIALGLFVVGARGLVDPAAGALADALPYFVIGFSLSAAAILLADTRRIRWAALALGFGHGALGLLVWSVLAG